MQKDWQSIASPQIKQICWLPNSDWLESNLHFIFAISINHNSFPNIALDIGKSKVSHCIPNFDPHLSDLEGYFNVSQWNDFGEGRMVRYHATFWISWVSILCSMLVSFVTVVLVIYFLYQPQKWLLGMHLKKYCIIDIIIDAPGPWVRGCITQLTGAS